MIIEDQNTGKMANSQLIIYQTEDGKIKIDVRFQDETVWLTQKLMAELFQTTKQNISLHLQNIFAENELDEYRFKPATTLAGPGQSIRKADRPACL